MHCLECVFGPHAKTPFPPQPCGRCGESGHNTATCKAKAITLRLELGQAVYETDFDVAVEYYGGAKAAEWTNGGGQTLLHAACKKPPSLESAVKLLKLRVDK